MKSIFQVFPPVPLCITLAVESILYYNVSIQLAWRKKKHTNCVPTFEVSTATHFLRISVQTIQTAEGPVIVQPLHVRWRWHARLSLSVYQRHQFFTLDQPTVQPDTCSALAAWGGRQKKLNSLWIITLSLSGPPPSLSAPRRLFQTSPSCVMRLAVTDTIHQCGMGSETKWRATAPERHARTRLVGHVLTPTSARRQTTAIGSDRLSMWRESAFGTGRHMGSLLLTK